MSNSARQVLEWFTSVGGTYDAECMDLVGYPDMGVGARALKDIPENTPLFSIPNELLLSATNSALRNILPAEEWEPLDEAGRWISLILCMMWEDNQGKESKWHGYLSALPTSFDTVIFWSEDELKLLEGTDIMGPRKTQEGTQNPTEHPVWSDNYNNRIGKTQVEADFHEFIEPLLAKYPQIFECKPSPRPETPFSLADYHTQGSRILSRSFSIPLRRTPSSKVSRKASEKMDVDGEGGEDSEEEDEDGDEDDEEEEQTEEAMVPMADMLNAVGGKNNARLEYEENGLQMYTLCPIKAGEQIYNTYNSPPNADLLRKYGHVDILPIDDSLLSDMPQESRVFPWGSETDVVDIPGDQITAEILRLVPDLEKGPLEERMAELVDWWLEEEENDTFTLDLEDPIALDMIVFTRLLTQPSGSKIRMPKPVVDPKVLEVVKAVLTRRLSTYPSTFLETQQVLVAGADDVSVRATRHYRALIVRCGEQRILHSALSTVEILHEQAKAAMGKKRTADGEVDGSRQTKKSTITIR